MTNNTEPLTNDILLQILARSKDATAIFTSQDLHIAFASDPMIALWAKGNVIGKTLEEALPELKDQPFIDILQTVWHSGTTYSASNTAANIMVDGVLRTFYFDFEYRAIKNDAGKTYAILHTATDITEQNKLRDLIGYSQHRLTQMISAAPMGMTILKGRDLIVEAANEPMLAIWGRSTEQIINKRILEVFPELIGQPFPQMLQDIFDTGKAIAIPEIAVDVAETCGTIKKLYVNFTYDPLFNTDGSVEAVAVSVIDITEMVAARKKLEDNEAELQQFNEELTAAYEEQEAANEELLVTNEELATAQAQLKLSNDKLIESENRIRSIFEQAPLGMCVLRGPEHVIELANESILRIWGRNEADVVGKPHHTARPELAGQPVYQWLDDVYASGITRVNNEFRVMLYDHGHMREAYVNSIYQPLRDASGKVSGIMVILDEITDAVKARQEAKRVQDMFNLAIDAGEFGTFYYDPVTNLFSGNDLLRSWFGLQPEEHLDLGLAINAIADADRDRVENTIRQVLHFASGGNYDIEYTIVNPVTQETRIVKAKGKTIFDEQGQALSLNGTVVDITERKKDEQRKNDFIGMVSHELKTPLTSLNAYLQILQSKAQKTDDSFTVGALDKAGKQVKRMTSIINGFLNVSRLESGKIHIDKQRFDMAQLVLETEEESVATISSHNVIFAPVEETWVEGDRDKIGQVINNLISNAVKYSPGNTTIHVACITINGNAQVSVKDQGIGINEQDIDKLFDRYYRVESDNTHTISGFGIGLYLSAEIIYRHNGKIWAESEYGHGSTFYFSIPLEAVG